MEFFQQCFHPFHGALSVGATVDVQNLHSHNGTPMPAARSVASCGPLPTSLPSITTAGTDRMPSCLAISATRGSFMSLIVMSHEGHAILLTSRIVSSQQPHPALKISTFLFCSIQSRSPLMHSIDLNRVWSATRTHGCFLTARQSIPEGCDYE